MKLSPKTVLFGASVTTVIGSVVAGLFMLGFPSEERARRVDERRVADLQEIVVATDLYWTRHSRLPASLDDLTAQPGVRISIGDPVSSEIYGYQPLDSARYEVCASFERESAGTSGDLAVVPPIIRESCQVCHQPGPVAPSTVVGPGGAHARLRSLWAHGSGRQCFQMPAGGSG